MVPDILSRLLLIRDVNVTHLRKGTTYSSIVHAFDFMAHNEWLLKTAIAAVNYDIDIYNHATAVACLRYLKLMQ